MSSKFFLLSTATCIAASASAPADSLKELIEYARRNPGKISYGTSGIGTGQHLAAELIKQLTGTDMVHVPYKSGAQVTTNLVGGQIPVSFGVLATAVPYLKSGKLKLLAIINDKRYQSLPDVPTVGEIIPGFESPPTWVGYFAPAGLPQPLLARLHAEMVKAVIAPEVAAKLGNVGFTVTTDAPGAFTSAIRQDIELVGRIVKAAGVQPE